MKKKIVNLIFLVGCFAFLCIGLLKTVFFPKDINLYENRYAEKVEPMSVLAFLDTSLQDNWESALADQVLFSQTLKKSYNDFFSNYKYFFLKPMLQADTNRYISFNAHLIFNGNICFAPRSLKEDQALLDEKIENYNTCFSAHPETDFYVYYIEKETDINFETKEKVPFCDYIFRHLALSENKMAAFEINSFADFADRFYKTDHHWNYKGSYEAYLEVLQLLGCGEQPLAPVDTVTLSHSFEGSKTADMDGLFVEDFTVYRFDYPPMTISVNGNLAADYGEAEAYLSSERTDVSYAGFYGEDNGEIVFDTNNTNKENILLIGESYDNAILKLVASHYNRTYSVDLRNYRAFMGEDFHLDSYVKENDISKVLLIGSAEYFIGEDFLLED